MWDKIVLNGHITEFKDIWTFEGKITVFAIHSRNAYKRSRSKAPPILNLGARWRLMVRLTLRPLYPRKEEPR